VGDDSIIEKALFGRVDSDPNMSIERRLVLDARLRRAALQKGFDCIVLLTPKSFQAFSRHGTIPRSIELNILNI
jgi:hypothetical protein